MIARWLARRAPVVDESELPPLALPTPLPPPSLHHVSWHSRLPPYEHVVDCSSVDDARVVEEALKLHTKVVDGVVRWKSKDREESA